ncbi:hypothetical protein COY23_00800 [bacterium (Candidatus Torokbacteria) CG_4_10_14_0_2_um_filter_35_8]|nr:MAG: hypothetical protein COY23_00800 [bacterium (Candidatus Torokbacteria) CG_4_10_14_0_2_um_filter_35_8]
MQPSPPSSQPPRPKSLSSSINLLPEQQEEARPSKIFSGTFTFAFIAIILLVGIYGAIFFYGQMQEEKLQSTNDQIAELDKTIDSYKEMREKAELLQKKLTNLERILAKHVHWSYLVSRFENATLKNVQFTKFATAEQEDNKSKKTKTQKKLAKKNAISLAGATSNYDLVAKQIAALEDEKGVEKVEFQQASWTEDAFGKGTKPGIVFNLEVTLSDIILIEKPKSETPSPNPQSQPTTQPNQ